MKNSCGPKLSNPLKSKLDNPGYLNQGIYYWVEQKKITRKRRAKFMRYPKEQRNVREKKKKSIKLKQDVLSKAKK